MPPSFFLLLTKLEHTFDHYNMHLQSVKMSINLASRFAVLTICGWKRAKINFEFNLTEAEFEIKDRSNALPLMNFQRHEFARDLCLWFADSVDCSVARSVASLEGIRRRGERWQDTTERWAASLDADL